MKTLLIAAALVAATTAQAAELSNPSRPLPQPNGATRWYPPHELQQCLRYRLCILVAGALQPAGNLSLLDSLEWASGAGGSSGAGDSGGPGGSSGGDAGNGCK